MSDGERIDDNAVVDLIDTSHFHDKSQGDLTGIESWDFSTQDQHAVVEFTLECLDRGIWTG